MQNYDSPGNILTFAVPPGGVASGAGVKVGQKLLVSTNAYAAGAVSGEGLAKGVVALPKVALEVWAQGDPLYWAAVAATNVPMAGAHPIGYAAAGALGPDATGLVQLDGYGPDVGAAIASLTLDADAALASLTLDAALTAVVEDDNLAGAAGANPTQAEFNDAIAELGTKVNAILDAIAELGTKVNAILAVLRAAGIIAT